MGNAFLALIVAKELITDAEERSDLESLEYELIDTEEETLIVNTIQYADEESPVDMLSYDDIQRLMINMSDTLDVPLSAILLQLVVE